MSQSASLGKPPFVRLIIEFGVFVVRYHASPPKYASASGIVPNGPVVVFAGWYSVLIPAAAANESFCQATLTALLPKLRTGLYWNSLCSASATSNAAYVSDQASETLIIKYLRLPSVDQDSDTCSVSCRSARKGPRPLPQCHALNAEVPMTARGAGCSWTWPPLIMVPVLYRLQAELSRYMPSG